MTQLLATQRYALILKELEEKTTVSIRGLTETLGVSRETVRKDIEHLAQTAKLEQVRGGATQVRTREVPMSERTRINAGGKARIARALAGLIPDGASVFLDNGSSMHALAEALRGHDGLRVYTNDIGVAVRLAPTCPELVLIGGRIDSAEMATFGIETVDQTERYHVDIAVVSAGGLTARTLLTDFSKDAVALRDRILRAGQTRYVIADQEKFGVVGQYAMPVPSAGTCIVMDQVPDADVLEAIEKHDLTYFIATEP